MYPILNNTKWDEVRLAMYGLGELSPQWRTKDVMNGYLSPWDGEWFYHFRSGGYQYIHWVEIKVDSLDLRDAVIDALAKIRVPGTTSEFGFKVFGYASPGESIDYLTRLSISPKPEAFGSAWLRR
jgi:hypothetical protein